MRLWVKLYDETCILSLDLIMPKTKKSKKIIQRSAWNEQDVELALLAVAGGNSIRATAAKYGMSEGVLRYRNETKRSWEGFIQCWKTPNIRCQCRDTTG